MMANGGPAFPLPVAEIQGRATHSGEFGFPGLSLRDYFAAAALAPVIAARMAEGDGPSDLMQESIAEECYELADALLAAREKASEPV
jgi:hypothetical protein